MSFCKSIIKRFNPKINHHLYGTCFYVESVKCVIYPEDIGIKHGMSLEDMIALYNKWLVKLSAENNSSIINYYHYA